MTSEALSALEADVATVEAWISVDSRLGAALLGARHGDIVAVDAPGGRRSVEVTAVA